jgi:serine/threonine protein kinase
MAVELFRPTASGYLAMDLKAVDVWAVGIILFTMACGRFAWAEATSRSPEFRRYRANDFTQAPWTNIARDQPVVYELLINMLALDAAQRWTIDQCIEYIETKWAEPVTPKRMRNLHNLRINIAKKHVTGAPDTPLSPLALSPQQRLTSSANGLFDYRSPTSKAA